MIDRYQEHASNERTFLAWVRTVIAIVGFGLGAARLGGVPQTSPWSEVAMLVAGALVLLLAFLRMRHVQKRIAAAESLEDDAVPTDTLLLLLIASLFVLVAAFTIHVT